MGLREFLRGKAGGPTAIAFAILAVALAVWMATGEDGASDAAAGSRDRIFIDAETGQSFSGHVEPGMAMPITSPFTGKNTGYQAELCYWTKDGQAKDEPTPVLLNEVVGKPGPTFCPDCERVVIVHNPVPAEGVSPPPTRQQVATGARVPEARR